MTSILFLGRRTRRMRPPSISDPFNTRTIPPTCASSVLRNNSTRRAEAFRSNWIRWTHIKVLVAIARCRTAALGGHIDECTRCGHRATISYNSCRNRHFPQRQTPAPEPSIQPPPPHLPPPPPPPPS